MKWLNGETEESKKNRKEQWCRWFAWYPVKIGTVKFNGKERQQKVWLEYLMRKGYRYPDFPPFLNYYWVYEYKEIEGAK
jgi:hypothetical protein